MTGYPTRPLRFAPPAPEVWTWGALVAGDSIVINGERDEIRQHAWTITRTSPHPEKAGWVVLEISKFTGIELDERATYRAQGDATIAASFPHDPALFVEPAFNRRDN